MLCVHMCVCALCSDFKVQKRDDLMDPLELDLQAVVNCQMWMLGTKLSPLLEQYVITTVDTFPQPQVCSIN